MRQIPYTMMKFAAFERTVEFLYKYVVPVPRDTLSKPKQLVVTFAAGYIAGVFCAIVSHPADSVVSKLNSDKGSTAWQAAKDLGMVGEYQLPIMRSYIVCCWADFTYHYSFSPPPRSVEGSWSQDTYDWYPDSSPVVHL